MVNENNYVIRISLKSKTSRSNKEENEYSQRSKIDKRIIH